LQQEDSVKKWIAILLASAELVGGVPSVTSAEDPATANRTALEDCLRKIGLRAQVHYQTSRNAGGVGGSFANMTLASVISWPTNAYGAFALSAPSATSVTLTGTGIETGWNGKTPVEVEVVVYADSMVVFYNN
jgi:hypothetical protein